MVYTAPSVSNLPRAEISLGASHVPHEPAMIVAASLDVGERGHVTGREKQGLVVCDERELPRMAIHRLSVRRRIV